MKKIFFILIGMMAAASTASADVLLTFDSDTQGFNSVDWNLANGSTAWSPNHGGSLALNFATAGWSNPVSQLNLTSTPELLATFNSALANGGTLTFDYIIDQADFTGYSTATPPDWFELVLIGNSDAAVGGGWDQNVLGGVNGYYGGIPLGPTTLQVTMSIGLGAPIENNGSLEYPNGSGWNELLIGINSQPGSFTGTTVYIDNLSITAIPEPSSVTLLGIMCLSGLSLYRRKS